MRKKYASIPYQEIFKDQETHDKWIEKNYCWVPPGDPKWFDDSKAQDYYLKAHNANLAFKQPDKYFFPLHLFPSDFDQKYSHLVNDLTLSTSFKMRYPDVEFRKNNPGWLCTKRFEDIGKSKETNIWKKCLYGDCQCEKDGLLPSRPIPRNFNFDDIPLWNSEENKQESLQLSKKRQQQREKEKLHQSQKIRSWDSADEKSRNRSVIKQASGYWQYYPDHNWCRFSAYPVSFINPPEKVKLSEKFWAECQKQGKTFTNYTVNDFSPGITTESELIEFHKKQKKSSSC